MEPFGRIFIILGVVLIIFGIVLTAGGRLNLGRLPGDIVVERENFRFYFPVMTGIVLSIVISVVLWIYNRVLR